MDTRYTENQYREPVFAVGVPDFFLVSFAVFRVEIRFNRNKYTSLEASNQYMFSVKPKVDSENG
jgi:hypothetical protein